MLAVITTNRTTLREFIAEDAPHLCALLGNEDIMKFGPGAQTQQQIIEWIADARRRYLQNGYGPWAVLASESQQLMGYCGLFHFSDLEGREEVEIGYRFAQEFHGKGYATEAAIGVRDYAFQNLGIRRLVAMIDPGNIPSLRLARRLGMEYEKDIMFEGYTHPDHLYVLEKSE